MDATELSRFEWLRQRTVPLEFLKELYGVDLAEEKTRTAYGQWLTARGNTPHGPGIGDRYHFETFLEKNRLEPLKYAAAGMGMSAESLIEVVRRLPRLGLVRDYRVLPGIVERDLEQDLISALPTTRFRTFGDHESFCLRLHQDLKKALDVNVAELRCATSAQLGEYPYRFAKTFDCITLEPLSVRHQVLLDLGKPMNLPPDRCSKLLYASDHDLLCKFVAGSYEPEDWKEYALETRT